MCVNCDIQLTSSGGAAIEAKEYIKYLGATLYSTGKLGGELTKRLGIAWGLFSDFERTWKHSSITTARKLEVFRSVVATKIMHYLNTAWLNKLGRRRLDGFQAHCLRRILHIPHAYVSRVSNTQVLEQAGQPSYTSQLLPNQLLWFGKVGRADDGDVLRTLTLETGSLRPASGRLRRPRGRPRHEWVKCR